jgi:hypothetical protein
MSKLEREQKEFEENERERLEVRSRRPGELRRLESHNKPGLREDRRDTE